MGAQAQESVFCYFVFVFDHNSDLPKKSFAYYSSAPSTVIDTVNYIELIDAATHRQYHRIPGKWVAIDKQTIGFKGRSGMKRCISYKREGDGFQCNALCDKGYTFSFFFQHGDTPKLGKLGCSFLQESEEFLKYSFLIFLEIFGNARTFLRTYNFGTGTKNECGRTWVWRSCGVCA